MAHSPSKYQNVDQAIRNGEKLVRESTRELQKLRKERERSEKVIRQTREASKPSSQRSE
jgi:predicted DNA-binding protein (UPF0278 family)